MGERRVRERRVTEEGRKGAWGVAQGQPGALEGAVGRGSRKIVRLNCPICKARINGFGPMLEHLVTAHDLGKRQAKFLAQKLVECRQ